MDLLSACKMAYRKHHLNDDSIGWDELGECLLDALCNAMGDDGYQKWLASQQADQPDAESRCVWCGKPKPYWSERMTVHCTHDRRRSS